MGQTRVIQRSFTGGEISSDMFGRIDDLKYQNGLGVCKNFIALPQGPIQNRAGFAFVNKAKYPDKVVRLIPFTFSNAQTMVLEFGDKYVRFHTDGKTLMTTSMFFEHSEQERTGEVPYEVETPYSADDLKDLHYVQSADVLTIVHPNYSPRELRRYSLTDWRLVEISFVNKMKAPTGLAVVQHINDKVTNKEDYEREYAVTALVEKDNRETEISEPKKIKCNPYGDGAYNTISWEAVEGADKYRVYRNEAGIWSYIGETVKLQINDENFRADSSITPPKYDDVFQSAKGITSVDVLNQGSGYPSSGIKSITLKEKAKYRFEGNTIYSGSYSHSQSFGPISGGVDPAPTFEITDERGKGAKIEPIINQGGYISKRDHGGTGGDRWHSAWADAYCEIQGFKVLNPGSDYTAPKLSPDYFSVEGWVRGFGEYREGRMPKTRDSWDLNAAFEIDINSEVNLIVEDSTGYGAELKAVVKDGKIIKVIVVQGGMNYSSPTIKVVSQSGSGATFRVNVGKAGDYPSAVTYFEQRRWFGGSPNKPNNIWATRTGTESNMTYSIPVQDTDRINVAIASRNADRVRHLVPLQQLMVLTPSAEWRVSPLNSDAITPTSMSVRPQSYEGANNVQPVVASSSAIYASERSSHLRRLGYSYEAGGYITADLSLRATHLFDFKKIVDMAFMKAPVPIVWCVSSSGELLGLTYIPEQNVESWHRHTTQGNFESVVCVAEGDEDVVYCAIKRYINGETVRTIERMQSRNVKDIKDAFFVDCGGTYKGEPTDTIRGLTWLEGQTVAILADGSVLPPQKVKEGQIKLENPASVVQVGLPYESDCMTLPIVLPENAAGMGIGKNISNVFLRCHTSSGVFVGTKFDSNNLVEYKQRTTEPYGTPPSLITGEISIKPKVRWTTDGAICIRQKDPLPLKLLSMALEVSI